MLEVMKSLGKRSIFFILILIQFFVSIFFFYISAAGVQSAFYTNIMVPKVLDVSTDSIIHMEIDSNANDDDFYRFVEEIEGDIVEKVLTYDVTSIYNDELGGEIGATELHSNIDAIKKFEMEEGCYFEAGDYVYDELNVTRENPISILVGYDIAEKYDLEVGNVITDLYRNNYYRIKGILEEDSKWFIKTVSEGYVLDLDSQVILPKKEQDYHELHYYCKVEENVTKDIIIAKIEQIGRNNDVDLQATFVSEELDEKFDRAYEANIYWMVFAIVLMIMISIGTTILFMAQMDSRRHEVGIKMAVGYSAKKIMKLMVGEVVVVVGVAFLGATALGKILLGSETENLWGSSFSYGYYISTDIILLGTLLTLAMCIPAIIAMCVKVKRLQPRELIGGNE